MKKTKNIEQLVRKKLADGKNSKQILSSFADGESREEALYFLNNLPAENQRRRYLWLNRVLCLLLFIITVKKLYDMAVLQLTAIAAGQFSPLLLLDLIVPMINFYVLSKLFRFHRQGYQFMAVLGVLALFRPENRIQPDLWIYLTLIGISIFLLRKFFPENHAIAG